MNTRSGRGTSIANVQAHSLRKGRTRTLSLLLGVGILALLVALAGNVSAQPAARGQVPGRLAVAGASLVPGSPDCGTTWTRFTSPNATTLDNQLFGIAVISSDDIWAVGWNFPLNGDAVTLTEHWDGNAW